MSGQIINKFDFITIQTKKLRVVFELLNDITITTARTRIIDIHIK